jgi:hypothetical protein
VEDLRGGTPRAPRQETGCLLHLCLDARTRATVRSPGLERWNCFGIPRGSAHTAQSLAEAAGHRPAHTTWRLKNETASFGEAPFELQLDQRRPSRCPHQHSKSGWPHPRYRSPPRALPFRAGRRQFFGLRRREVAIEALCSLGKSIALNARILIFASLSVVRGK